MGALKDLAKQNSKFLKIDKGAKVVVEYVGYEIVRDSKDPSKKIPLYEFREMGKEKFWNNSSSSVMYFFDELPKGTLVQIHRDQWENKDGTFDPNKSAYKVTRYEEHPGNAQQTQQTSPKEDKPFQAKNPNNVTSPEEIWHE